MKAPPKRRGPLGGGPSPRTGEASLHRRSVTEEDFCRCCGHPLVGLSIRSCIACGRPEPHRQLRVREADGRIGWLPVPDAVAKGGR
jgi:ribosomal protein L37E